MDGAGDRLEWVTLLAASLGWGTPETPEAWCYHRHRERSAELQVRRAEATPVPSYKHEPRRLGDRLQ